SGRPFTASARGFGCDSRHGRAISRWRARYHDFVFRSVAWYRLCLRRPAFERRHHSSPPEAGPGGSSRAFPEIQVRMDLHVYRTSQDRWYDLRESARRQGAVLAINAVTLADLIERITPELKTATIGQQLAIVRERDLGPDRLAFSNGPYDRRYLFDAIS